MATGSHRPGGKRVRLGSCRRSVWSPPCSGRGGVLDGRRGNAGDRGAGTRRTTSGPLRADRGVAVPDVLSGVGRPRRDSRSRASAIPPRRRRRSHSPDWWSGDDRPLVYVRFGSVAATFPPAASVYASALDAVAELPARGLLTTGGHDAQRVRRRVPARRRSALRGPAGERGSCGRGRRGRRLAAGGNPCGSRAGPRERPLPRSVQSDLGRNARATPDRRISRLAHGPVWLSSTKRPSGSRRYAERPHG